MFSLSRLQQYFSFPVHETMDHDEYFTLSFLRSQNVKICLGQLVTDLVPRQTMVGTLQKLKRGYKPFIINIDVSLFPEDDEKFKRLLGANLEP